MSLYLKKKIIDIPFIISNIEIVNCCEYYSIGKLKNELFLLVEISFAQFANCENNSKSVLNYEKYINMLLVNNSLNETVLTFYGIFLDKMTLKYYLVFDYPIYTLNGFLLNENNKYNGDFGKEKQIILEQFYHFITSTFVNDFKFLLLFPEFIFLDQNKNLKLLFLGAMESNLYANVSVPTSSFALIKNILKNNKKKLCEMYSLYSSATQPRVGELICDLWSKFAFFVFSPSNPGICSLSDLNINLAFNPESTVPQNICEVLYFITTSKSGSSSQLNPLSLLNALYEDEKQKVKNIHKSLLSFIDNPVLMIKHQSLSEMLSYIGYNNESDSTTISIDIIESSYNVIPLKEQLMNFMVRHFPPKNEYECSINIYCTEINKSCIYFLRQRDIPIPNTKKKIKKENFRDNLMLFKYDNFSNSHNRFTYMKIFDPKQIKEEQLNKWIFLSKKLWPIHYGYPYKEDIALKFLCLCNYDIYKSIFYIEYINNIFIKFLKKEYELALYLSL